WRWSCWMTVGLSVVRAAGAVAWAVLFFVPWARTRHALHSFLHDALPISRRSRGQLLVADPRRGAARPARRVVAVLAERVAQLLRSEEHTSELQSRGHLVCRLLLEKKKQARLRSHNRH